MPGEDQERFEDYLELERYIEALQAGRVAHPPSDLTPTQARVYRAAALFRSASPDAATPRPEFMEELQARLLALDQTENEEVTEKIPAVKKAEKQVVASMPVEQDVPAEEELEHPAEQEHLAASAGEELEHPGEQEGPIPPTPVRKNTPRRASFFSRRSLLTGSAVAAASLVVGTGIGAMAERSAATSSTSASHPPAPTTGPGGYRMPLVEDGRGIWQFVGTLDQIGDDAVRFVTDTIVGYVIRSDGDEGEKAGEIIAMSAACTHMGCTVQWQSADHQFHCPCHDGIFTEYGKASPNGRMKYLAPLPRMETKILNDKDVYVLVPKSAKSGA